MENLSTLNFSKVCRVCLSECEQTYSIFSDLDEVYSEENEMPPIFEILTTISDMKIEIDDGLPSLICTKCIDTAHTSFKFRLQCNQSQAILNAYTEQYLKGNCDIKNELPTLDMTNKIDSLQETEENFNDSLSLKAVTIETEGSDDDSYTDFPTIRQISHQENSEDIDPLSISSSDEPFIPKNENPIETTQNKKEEKSYACLLCDKSYKYASGLQVHMRNHTQEKPYSCKTCGKSFKQYSSLVYHHRSHTGEQPYACKLCGKRYKQSGTLTAHMRVHTGHKPFLCSICGRGFRQATDLRYHMRFHTKEKPYMCNVCGKTMSMQSHLVQHMRTHTGERPFKCSVCEKAFPSSTRLKRHAIIHTSLRPYSCKVCSKSFNRTSSLKVHSKIHRDERTHVCLICNKGYIQAHALKSHLASHSSELHFKA